MTEQLARQEIARAREQLAELRAAYGNYVHAIDRAIGDAKRSLPFEREAREAHIAELLTASDLAQQAHDKAARQLLARIKTEHTLAGITDEYA